MRECILDSYGKQSEDASNSKTNFPREKKTSQVTAKPRSLDLGNVDLSLLRVFLDHVFHLDF